MEKNTTIYYNVSKGEESLTVPDVTNRTQEDAEQILADMGFVVNVEKVYIDDYDTYVDAGYVISTDPEAGTSANSGDQITILVSRGEDWGEQHLRAGCSRNDRIRCEAGSGKIQQCDGCL